MTNTSFGFCGEIAMPMRPMRPPGSPFFFAGSVSRVHVLRPSSELSTPSPQYCERRLFFSPVPTHTMVLSEGATARSPTVSLPRPLETDCQVTPPLVVFHTPPPAAPM